MAGKTKRIFKVFSKSQDQYVPLGYNGKATWTKFPAAAIQYSHRDLNDLEVHEFEVNPVRVATWDINHNVINK